MEEFPSAPASAHRRFHQGGVFTHPPKPPLVHVAAIDGHALYRVGDDYSMCGPYGIKHLGEFPSEDAAVAAWREALGIGAED